MLLSSCTNVLEEKFVGSIQVLVTEYRAGPAVEDADVLIFNSGNSKKIGIARTGSTGIANVKITEIPEYIDVKCIKNGHALSYTKNIKTSNVISTVLETVMRKADLNKDPLSQKSPVVFIEYLDSQLNELDMTISVKNDFKVRISVDDTFNHAYKIFKPLFNSVPKDNMVKFDDNTIGENEYVTEATQSVFDISIAGYNGESELNFVVYDRNGNRVHIVEYLNIEKNDNELPVNPYIPVKFKEFQNEVGSYNIHSFTRRRGKQVYGSASRTAPEGGNLWINLYWADYTSANVNGVLSPEGYNVYRSFDGGNYHKIGFVNENYASGKATDSLPLFTDDTPLLKPGKKVFYAISSVYGTSETELVKLGSVIPLDSFNVELMSPKQNETEVSRNPNLKWRPTKALSSEEGIVKYHYVPFIYDWVHGEHGQTTKPMLPIIVNGEDNNMCIFTVDSPSNVIVPFTGNKTDSTWGCIWKRICPGGGKLFELKDDKLQANKSYDWGINVAYADVRDEDSISRSIAADFRSDYTGWGFDPYPGYMEPDLHAVFTTGTK